MTAKSRLYMISISGRARRLLLKQNPKMYRLYKNILEELYPVEAKNGSEAKKKFTEEYVVTATFFEKVAETLRLNINEVLRAYPPYAAYG